MPDEPSNGANRFLTREVFRSSVGEGSFWGSGHLRTKNNITGQVNALKAIAEIEGYVVNRYEDLTKEFAGRTDVEKEFFASHGYWPNEVEPSQPGSPGSESASEVQDKPN